MKALLKKSLFLFRSCIALISIIYLQSCAHVQKPFNNALPQFEEIPVEYKHKWRGKTHPFSGAAVLDIDNDGKMEIYISGGEGQRDALLSYQQQRLINISDKRGLLNESATYGATAIDLNDDGNTDIIVAREDGVFLYINHDGKFISKKIPVTLPKQAVPFSVAVADIDHDGDGDLYISVFVEFNSFRSGVFNDPDHAKSNRLLINDGNLNFTDITQSAGVRGKNNTFFSSFVDLDNDGWQDLVLAQNTGEVEIWKNNGDLSFQAVPIESGFGFWMGLAIGDIDNDGDQDLFFSNVGHSIPRFLVKGDIQDHQPLNREWLLLRNDGKFTFTDVTQQFQLTGKGFSWGAVFEDLNLDGQLDLLVAQNYIKWPVHKVFKLQGEVLLQGVHQNNPGFYKTTQIGLKNDYFGQSPLIVDLNLDAKPDVVWINMNGPVRAFLNSSTNNSLAIIPPDSVDILGTRINVEMSDGNIYTREIITNSGMLTDQTPVLFFGLDKKLLIDRVIIEKPNKQTEIIHTPKINQRIFLR